MSNAPSFICIGAQKAGTTWLDQQLRKHPEIWMPPMKEVHFFDYIYRPEFRKWILWHLEHTMRRELSKVVGNKQAIDWSEVSYFSSIMRSNGKFTDEWYEYIFSKAPPGKVTGEITPEYSTLSSQAITHMNKLCSNPVYIYIIRDPVERAWSQLKMNMVRNGDYKRAVREPLINAMSADQKRKKLTQKQSLRIVNKHFKAICNAVCKSAVVNQRLPNSNEVVDINIFHENIKHYSIEDRADYSTYVPRWDSLKDKILYLPFGDIRNSPKEVLSTVSSFIGVSEDFDFTGSEERIHKGSGLKMPKEVRDHLAENMNKQYQFLEKRFGKSFLSKI
ncbi:sulfotransferase [Synechocystis sp. LEGE 06083]|nr:sulfotransferase [Synechocystis sp. LEGE 06083]MBE9197245.1 sulfotransferase [Synechocystis sp. LEGE 06083]